MKEAVAKMKAELGDDAVILHTKKYKEGGLLGLGSKEMVEITAAIEDEKPAPKKEPEIPQRTTPIMPPSVLSQYKTNGTAEGVAMAEREANPPPRNLLDENSEEEKSAKSASMMSPTVNQATSLEEAMKPGQRPARPDPPMPYDDDEENSTTPYELDISSKSDLNISRAEQSVDSDVQNEDKQFVHSSSEIDESAVENEPDENVYAAEPENSSIKSDSDDAASVQFVQKVPDAQNYSDTSTIIESATTQINTSQPNIIIEKTQPQEPVPLQLQQQPQSVQNVDVPPAQPVQNQVQTPQAPPPQPVQPVQPIQNQVNIPPQPPQENFAQQPPQNAQEQAANVNQTQTQAQTQAQTTDMSQPLTPAQLAQAQAMQQAVAQAQAQAQEQVRQAYLQAQQAQQAQAQTQAQQSNENLQKASHSSNESQSENRESQDKIKKLENEIAQMKALLAQVIGKETNRGVSLHEALRRQEVSEDILNNMAAHAEAGETLTDSQSREAKSTLVKFLKENVNFSEGIKLNRHGVRIVALLGTTGVGKTTTLAKIAAKFVLEQGITAALITADTYRISAVEQLRTYSDILGLPLEIVYSPAELSKAINKHRNRDLILIDTAGRSQHNDYQMKELQEFLAANQRIEKHIVLSTTTKSSDANDILDKFSVCEPDKIIFTKTDETASVGLMVNLLFNQKLSMSYVTNGQSVPDDITPASAEILADLLLRRNF